MMNRRLSVIHVLGLLLCMALASPVLAQVTEARARIDGMT